MAETEVTTEHPVGTHHGSPPLIPCPKCDATFSNRSGLSSHLRAAHKLVDQEAHARWQRRKKVIEARKGKGSGKFVCPVKGCGKRFLTPTGLGSHKRTHGIEGQSSSMQYYKPKQKKQTAAVIPTDKIVPKNGVFRCPECRQPFKAARALGRHRSAKHQILGTSKSVVQTRARQQKSLVDTLAKAGAKLGLEVGTEADLLTCQEPGCGKGPFKTHSGLMIHLATMHRDKGATVNGRNGASGTDDNIEVARAFWINNALRDCEAYAARVELLPEDFVSRLLAVVSRSSAEVRKRYRLTN